VTPALAEVRDRLNSIDHEYSFDLGRPAGASWWDPDAITSEVIGRWLDELEAHHGGRDVAASYLAGWLAAGVVGAPMAALAVVGALPGVAAGSVRLRRHPGGWFDRAAIDESTRLLDAADPATPATFCAGVVDVLAPLFDLVRADAPYGRSGMWGALADALANGTVHAARRFSLPPERAVEAWERTTSIVAELGALRPELRGRPRPFPVRRGDTVELYAVRGVCCLAYKSATVRGLPDHVRYCVSCPLVDDGVRVLRLRHV
jgi:hypothetical protein